MRIVDVQIKKLQAICDLMGASPSGPNKFDQALAANVCKDVARLLENNNTELMADAAILADNLRS